MSPPVTAQEVQGCAIAGAVNAAIARAAKALRCTPATTREKDPLGPVILLIVGIGVLWLWVRGNILGMIGMFAALVFTFGPSAHPDWSWHNQDDDRLIAFFLLIAIAPIALLHWAREGEQKKAELLAARRAAEQSVAGWRDGSVS